MPANTNVHTSRTPHIWKTIWQESLKLEFAMEVLHLEHFCPCLGDISELLNNLSWELLFKRNWIFQLHFQTLYFCTLIRLLAKKKSLAPLGHLRGPNTSPWPHPSKKELRMEKCMLSNRTPASRVQSLISGHWSFVQAQARRCVTNQINRLGSC